MAEASRISLLNLEHLVVWLHSSNIVAAVFFPHLESRALITDNQYVFRKNRCIGDLMSYLAEKWNQAIRV